VPQQRAGTNEEKKKKHTKLSQNGRKSVAEAARWLHASDEYANEAFCCMWLASPDQVWHGDDLPRLSLCRSRPLTLECVR
jgi:hypothetical protein